jgi:hypothetical protein
MAISDRNLTALVGVVLIVSVLSLGMTAVRFMGGVSTTGAATGTTQVSVASVVAISLPTNNINFGSMTNGASNQTDTNNPAPFIIQNDGTVLVNITINATNLWTGTGGANPSVYYRVRANDSTEGNCYLTADSQTAYMNMPATGSPTSIVKRLNFPNSCDSVQVHVNVTVPNDEAAGAKTSTVEFLAIQS